MIPVPIPIFPYSVYPNTLAPPPTAPPPPYNMTRLQDPIDFSKDRPQDYRCKPPTSPPTNHYTLLPTNPPPYQPLQEEPVMVQCPSSAPQERRRQPFDPLLLPHHQTDATPQPHSARFWVTSFLNVLVSHFHHRTTPTHMSIENLAQRKKNPIFSRLSSPWTWLWKTPDDYDVQKALLQILIQ